VSKRTVWFVTGCDSGVGKAVARGALENGDIAVATALDRGNAADLEADFPGLAHVHELDVTNAPAISEVVGRVLADCDQIDVLVNCAGYGVMGAVEETGPELYRPMFDVNFFGTAETIRAVLPGMRERRSGFIFNVSSSAGYDAPPGMALYGASKYAVEGLSDGLAKEVAAFGISVTILELGSFRTQFAGANLKRPTTRIEDYHTESAMRLTTERMNARDGTQPNDPAKLAELLTRIVAGEIVAPLRLPLGEDCFKRVLSKAGSVVTECEGLRGIAHSVAMDE
jgi:NAD(P)-dependent dehydrogenase (short-subunit alcohol dehydrogenase family)